MDVNEVPDWIAAGDLVYRPPLLGRMTSASGLRLYDDEGFEYLDAEAANGAMSWGYDADILREACLRALPLPALPSFCESGLRVRVLERLAERISRAVGVPGRVAIELGGAQGIEMAMRIVAANRGALPVMTFQGGYHGRSPFTAHLSASSRYRAVQPWPGPDVIRLPFPDCASCSHRQPEGGCNPACAAAITRLGSDDRLGTPPEVAALVLEPLLNVGGFVLPDPRHVRQVAEHVR
jgi:4-aminobutyrate aminotransferase-like enzyme